MEEEILDDQIVDQIVLQRPVQKPEPAEYRVLDALWYTPRGIFGMQLYIGVVAVETFGPTDEWKAYIGIVPGINAEDDKQAIAARGAGVLSPIAAAYFPQLDITKYKDS
jgi:hypothetical protein